MNPQIQKLFEQAKSESSQWLGSKPATTVGYDELERFAELIVRECADVAGDDWDTAGRAVLKHFGVNR